MKKRGSKPTCLCGTCRKCKNRLAQILYRARRKKRRFYDPEYDAPSVFKVGSSLDPRGEFDISLD